VYRKDKADEIEEEFSKVVEMESMTTFSFRQTI
jgi:hypothetical protein